MEEEIQQVSHSQTSQVQNSNQVLLNHPIFAHENDPLLQFLTKTVKMIISQNFDASLFNYHAQNWLKHLLLSMFPTPNLEFLKGEFQKLELSFDTICGKLIGNGEIYFRCLDCDQYKAQNSSIFALLCSHCFDNSNHVGHRVLMSKLDASTSGTCDCGDHVSLDPNGFCKDHLPKEYCIIETLNKFPQEFLNAFIINMKKAFYGVISLFELSFTANDQTKEKLSSLAQLTLSGILDFCMLCSKEINEAFLIVFGQIFQSSFLPSYSQLWHDCQDLKNEKGVQEISTESRNCNCTVTGSLLRISGAVFPEIQEKLNKVLIECSKESSFKVFLTVEFTKYLHFIYSQSYSQLLNMKVQLYSSEDLCFEVLKSGYFSNYIDILKKSIHSSLQVDNYVYILAYDIQSVLLNFLSKPKTRDILIKNTSFLGQMLEILMNIQIKFTYRHKIHIGVFDHEINYEGINKGLLVEKAVSQVLETGFQAIASYPYEEQIPIMRNFMKAWYECFETTKAVLNEELKDGVVSFHPILERTLTSILKIFTKELTEENMRHFLRETLPGAVIQKLAENVIEGCLKTLGMVRFIHLVHNYNSGRIWQAYYFANNLFFESDFLTIQSMTVFLEPNKIFELFVQCYFSYNSDLVEFFRNPNSLTSTDAHLKQKLLVLEDFLHLFIYVINDETCVLNLNLNKERSSEESQLNKKSHEVIEKILANLLISNYWVDVPQLKETMKNVLVQHPKIDDILHHVAFFDEKNKKVRLRNEYMDKFDPYIFFRDPALQSTITHNVSSNAQKDKKADIVSGVFQKDSIYLKAIQNKVFQSVLPNYLMKIFFSFQNHTAVLLRPTLKLILTNLQVAEDFEDLKGTIQENYFAQDFANKLAEVEKSSDFEDCKLCIDKIQKIKQSLNSNSQQMIIEKRESPSKEDSNALKKKLAHQRMQQLKEEFMKKQKMFLHKNSHGDENTPPEKMVEEKEKSQSQNDEENLTCQYCLDKIKKGVDHFGVPAYISFSNNLRDIEENQAKNASGFEGDWWPVITSCLHYYHENCFQAHCKNTRTSKEMSVLFSNEFESYCSLCKTLCNAFLPEENYKDKIPNQEEKTEESLTLPFEDALQSILNGTKTKLTSQSETQMEEESRVPTEEVFMKGYVHFLESFHSIEKVSAFEKKIKVYKLLLNEYISKIKTAQNPQTPSFLVKAFSHECFNDPLLQGKIGAFSNFKPEVLLSSINFEFLTKSLPAMAKNMEELNVFQEQFKILKEYIAFKTVQLVLYCKEQEPVTLQELYPLYKEDQELREDVQDELLFPLQQFVLASYFNKLVISEEKHIDSKLLETLINTEDDIPSYLDKLVNCIWMGESFDQLIEKSLEELLTKPEYITSFMSQVLSYNGTGLKVTEPRSIKLEQNMIELPKNYLEFISVYLKKKCSQCNEYSKHMSTAICLLCGDVICVSFCPVNPQKRGNLNLHAQQYHLGNSLFIDLQRFSKIAVGSLKNSIYAGKEVYIDKLGHSISSLINDPRCLLYSLDFNTFALNQDFVQETQDIIGQNSMTQEIYKITTSTGRYYREGTL